MKVPLTQELHQGREGIFINPCVQTHLTQYVFERIWWTLYLTKNKYVNFDIWKSILK